MLFFCFAICSHIRNPLSFDLDRVPHTQMLFYLVSYVFVHCSFRPVLELSILFAWFTLPCTRRWAFTIVRFALFNYMCNILICDGMCVCVFIWFMWLPFISSKSIAYLWQKLFQSENMANFHSILFHGWWTVLVERTRRRIK